MQKDSHGKLMSLCLNPASEPYRCRGRRACTSHKSCTWIIFKAALRPAEPARSGTSELVAMAKQTSKDTRQVWAPKTHANKESLG